jgi:hypothetical protein
MERLGVDIGGVIIVRGGGGADTSFFSDDYLSTPAVEGAMEVLAALAAHRFGDAVYIVSKCGEATERRTLAWFAAHRFFARTGIAPERVRFCRRRTDKAPICAEFGITHFVDDRLEVLSYLAAVPRRYLFQARPAESAPYLRHLAEVVAVQSWREISDDLLAG